VAPTTGEIPFVSAEMLNFRWPRTVGLLDDAPSRSPVANLARIDEVAPVSARRSALQQARDLVTLTKPRITVIVLVTAAGGMKLASKSPIAGTTWLATLIGTALVVGAANALNMWWERDVDGKMERTKNRPLPAGRLSANVALIFGLLLGVVSLPILFFGVNPMTGLLGAIALASYVLLYTPMKRHSVRALWVGAIPGAIPPLLGWTAVTGRIDAAGVALFSILFIWQIPHFLAISIFRADDYARAGLKVVPVELGERATNGMMFRYTIALLAVTVWPYLAGVGSKLYLGVAIALGAMFLVLAARAFRMTGDKRIGWARGVFGYSILYLVILFAVLVATA
jgi:protoheme IX farnesyltransferase